MGTIKLHVPQQSSTNHHFSTHEMKTDNEIKKKRLWHMEQLTFAHSQIFSGNKMNQKRTSPEIQVRGNDWD